MAKPNLVMRCGKIAHALWHLEEVEEEQKNMPHRIKLQWFKILSTLVHAVDSFELVEELARIIGPDPVAGLETLWTAFHNSGCNGQSLERQAIPLEGRIDVEGLYLILERPDPSAKAVSEFTVSVGLSPSGFARYATQLAESLTELLGEPVEVVEVEDEEEKEPVEAILDEAKLHCGECGVEAPPGNISNELITSEPDPDMPAQLQNRGTTGIELTFQCEECETPNIYRSVFATVKQVPQT